MTQQPPVITANMFPCLFYRDANAAIDFLERAFGFEHVMVVPGENGTVAHAELRYGSGMIMLGTAGTGMPNTKSPLDLGGSNQSTYIYIDDTELDAHYARARAAGATIIRELERKDYGGGGYSARDLEHHDWSFGSYMPEYPAKPY